MDADNSVNTQHENKHFRIDSTINPFINAYDLLVEREVARSIEQLAELMNKKNCAVKIEVRIEEK